MKLMVIAIAAALSVAHFGPAFAAGGDRSAASEAQLENSMEALQGEAVKAGTTDEQRASYFNTMKPERQAAWKEHCVNMDAKAKDPAEVQAFCNAIPK